MKLFQQLLVAGAAASMIAPFAAQATDVNLEDMNSYSNSSKSAGFTNNYLNIQPGDWAHQSIKDLAKSRGCDINVSDKTKPVSIKESDYWGGGANPEVSAEMGGDGFNLIAESLGYGTNELKGDGSPDAVKGGRVVMHYSSYPNTLRTEGMESNSQTISFFGSLIYETILGFDGESMQWKPKLATHWKVSEDQQTFSAASGTYFTSFGRYFVLTEGQEKPKKTSAPKSEEVDVEKELEKLKALLDKGLIIQEQYDAKSNKLLGLE